MWQSNRSGNNIFKLEKVDAMASLLFQLIVYIRCHHLIIKGPQALSVTYVLCSKKIRQLKDRSLHIYEFLTMASLFLLLVH